MELRMGSPTAEKKGGQVGAIRGRCALVRFRRPTGCFGADRQEVGIIRPFSGPRSRFPLASASGIPTVRQALPGTSTYQFTSSQPPASVIRPSPSRPPHRWPSLRRAPSRQPSSIHPHVTEHRTGGHRAGQWGRAGPRTGALGFSGTRGATAAGSRRTQSWIVRPGWTTRLCLAGCRPRSGPSAFSPMNGAASPRRPLEGLTGRSLSRDLCPGLRGQGPRTRSDSPLTGTGSARCHRLPAACPGLRRPGLLPALHSPVVTLRGLSSFPRQRLPPHPALAGVKRHRRTDGVDGTGEPLTGESWCPAGPPALDPCDPRISEAVPALSWAAGTGVAGLSSHRLRRC